jgi:branched-chain amino acid transport system permease protein
MLAQLIVMGLATGCTYALIAIAMVIIYKTSEILNFAQGELAMFSTFIAFLILTGFGAPFAVAIPAALTFAMVLGALCELLFLYPARERVRAVPLLVLWGFTGFVGYMAVFPQPGVPKILAILVALFAVWMTAETFSRKRPPRKPTLIGLIIITLGLEMILYGMAGWIWGANQQALPSPVSDTSVRQIGSVVISDLNILVFAVSIFSMSMLFLFFRYSRIGIAMKATAQNIVAARLMGIRTTRIFSFTWAISSLMGAIGGLLIASASPLDPNIMMEPLLKGFAAAVLGGMNSLPGTILGGCILGVLENLVAGYLPEGTQFKSTIAFVVIVLMLVVRPSGLLGHHYVKKV